MKKNILVTGGAGFVGTNLVRRLLADGHTVNLFLKKETDFWRLSDIKKEIKIERGDLSDPSWIKRQFKNIKPEIVFHLAHYGGNLNQKDPQKIVETNLLATINLLSAAEEIGFKKFIYTGSTSEYGNKKKPMSEDDLLEPNSVYAVSKAAGTLYCQHRGRDAKLPVVALRLFSAYGPWEGPIRLIPTVVLKCLNGGLLELSSSSIARDFVYVDDIVDALIKTMELSDNTDFGEIINICTGNQSTVGAVVKKTVELTKANVEIKWGSREKRSYDTDIWVGNPSKAKKILGWKAKTNLQDGIKKTIDWMKENKTLYEKRLRK